MRVTDALKILRGAPTQGKPFEVTLACGFTPLHLQTFLGAYLQQALPHRHVTVSTGLYGDIARTIEEMAVRGGNNLVVAIEWMDLDPRLGHRSPVVWNSGSLSEILSFVPKALERLAKLIERVTNTSKVVISTPTLPFPPLFHGPSWQMSKPETVLVKLVAEFAVQMANLGIPIVNSMKLSEESAPSLRYDL